MFTHMADTTRERLANVFRYTLDIPAEKVQDDANIADDLEADSLGLVELILAVEDEFEIDILDEDVEGIQTFGEALQYVEKRLREG
jgi:acyl carrier protein